MLHDAEKYKDDEEQKGRIDAKHHLESYANSVKNSVKDDKIATNIDSGEKQGDLEEACNEAIEWLDHNQQATKEAVNFCRMRLMYHPVVIPTTSDLLLICACGSDCEELGLGIELLCK
ncbi:hypothetical protein Pelo_13219 [Pelomyxa schiedti]|nr:hypothetical protein Pelo_13219 [Pelomyxa schiedti]